MLGMQKYVNVDNVKDTVSLSLVLKLRMVCQLEIRIPSRYHEIQLHYHFFKNQSIKIY